MGNLWNKLGKQLADVARSGRDGKAQRAAWWDRHRRFRDALVDHALAHCDEYSPRSASQTVHGLANTGAPPPPFPPLPPPPPLGCLWNSCHQLTRCFQSPGHHLDVVVF